MKDLDASSNRRPNEALTHGMSQQPLHILRNREAALYCLEHMAGAQDLLLEMDLSCAYYRDILGSMYPLEPPCFAHARLGSRQQQNKGIFDEQLRQVLLTLDQHAEVL